MSSGRAAACVRVCKVADFVVEVIVARVVAAAVRIALVGATGAAQLRFSQVVVGAQVWALRRTV